MLGRFSINVQWLDKVRFVVLADELLVHVHLVAERHSSLLDVNQLAHFHALIEIVLHGLSFHFLLPSLYFDLLLADLVLHHQCPFVNLHVVDLTGCPLFCLLLSR